MKNFEILDLDNMTLKAVNGGNQQSYNEGARIGEALRKTIMLWTLTSWMF